MATIIGPCSAVWLVPPHVTVCLPRSDKMAATSLFLSFTIVSSSLPVLTVTTLPPSPNFLLALLSPWSPPPAPSLSMTCWTSTHRPVCQIDGTGAPATTSLPPLFPLCSWKADVHTHTHTCTRAHVEIMHTQSNTLLHVHLSCFGSSDTEVKPGRFSLAPVLIHCKLLDMLTHWPVASCSVTHKHTHTHTRVCAANSARSL